MRLVHAPGRARARGLTLVELMVSLVLSTLIVLATTAFYVGSSTSRDSQDVAAQLQDSARFATDIITKTLEQAGYQNYVSGRALLREAVAPADGEPDLRGYNNSSAGTDLNNGAHDCTGTCATNRVNNSDTLVVRFQGSSDASGNADGSMIDCLGRPQAATTSTNDRLYSIFEVRLSSGEPELRCKYNGSSGFDSQVIVRGVETLQFMYGVDTDGDTFVDQWLTAKQVDNLDADAVKAWGRVRSVRVGMVIRSAVRTNLATAVASYQPLGAAYTNGTADTGSTFSVTTDDGRLRRVVSFTVSLRNAIRSSL